MGIFKRKEVKSNLVTVHYGEKRELDNFIVQKVFDGAIAFVEIRTKADNFKFTIDIGCPVCSIAMGYIDGDDSVSEYLGAYAMILYMNATRFITPDYIIDECKLIKKDVKRISKYIDRDEHTEKADKEAIDALKGMYEDMEMTKNV